MGAARADVSITRARLRATATETTADKILATLFIVNHHFLLYKFTPECIYLDIRDLGETADELKLSK